MQFVLGITLESKLDSFIHESRDNKTLVDNTCSTISYKIFLKLAISAQNTVFYQSTPIILYFLHSGRFRNIFATITHYATYIPVTLNLD